MKVIWDRLAEAVRRRFSHQEHQQEGARRMEARRISTEAPWDLLAGQATMNPVEIRVRPPV
ncbi:OLC1v1031724C1 [Oldenlandia corymbosa var. corymbosa]|uniref:OLC1v1031724C1 n=1 Tax=Oldenlandia corymbosa var. corymbosa TaxID=529605 RepID=A0AAV1CM23_OLDCO|nr:OLC1v1031724C1 [Oldenlandia corymbosa var. corymbosa]